METETKAPETTEPVGVAEQQPVATPKPTDAPAPTPVAETPTWDQLLEKADSKAVRSHPKIAGIIGSEIQRAIQAERQRTQAEEGGKAAREAEARLRKMAQDDPVTFAEQWLSDDQKQDIRRQLDEIRGKTRAEYATNTGRAFQDVPEWKDLTEADHEALAKALMGKQDDEVIPLFTRHVTELIAEKRAQKLLAQWKDKELANERKAIRDEEAAKLMKGSDAPDGARPRGTPAKFTPESMPQEDFDRYWQSLKERKT